MPKKPHRPPSQIRYEESHPVVSVRVSEELKARLDEVRQLSGKSFGDILREVVGVQDESAGAAYDQGWNEAWHQAYTTYAVSYPCFVCGKTIVVQTDAEKKALAQYMRQHGWGHASCVQA